MKSRVLVLLLLLLWLWPALVIAYEARWEQYMRAGVAAYQRGDYEEAVGQTKEVSMTDRRPQSHLVAYPRTGNRLATADRGTGPDWATEWGFHCHTWKMRCALLTCLPINFYRLICRPHNLSVFLFLRQ